VALEEWLRRIVGQLRLIGDARLTNVGS
jgi:hypothetical protein